MGHDVMIRQTTRADKSAILDLYPRTFPDQDLQPLVDALLTGRDPVLSLGAFVGGAAVAHVLCTLCRGGRAALLGPLCVLPARQKRGLGSRAVWAGCDALSASGVGQVFVLGDPKYYGRFGFAAERKVPTPCPIPDHWADAWQSLVLPGGAPLGPVPLLVPEPWRDPALWSDQP